MSLGRKFIEDGPQRRAGPALPFGCLDQFVAPGETPHSPRASEPASREQTPGSNGDRAVEAPARERLPGPGLPPHCYPFSFLSIRGIESNAPGNDRVERRWNSILLQLRSPRSE